MEGLTSHNKIFTSTCIILQLAFSSGIKKFCYAYNDGTRTQHFVFYCLSLEAYFDAEEAELPRNACNV
jgi:hypothetical protein